MPTVLHVAALRDFLQIVTEVADSRAEPLRQTATWRQAIEPTVRIHQSGSSEALAYLLAMNAGLPDAREWVQKNTAKIDELLRQPGK